MSRSTLITAAGVGGQPGGVPLLDGNSGLLVPSYTEITQQGSAPAAPAAGKTRLYVDANGLLQLVAPTAAANRRIAAHWGSGTAFPAGAATGDTFLRTDIGTTGTLYQYAGAGQGAAGWITEAAVVCTSTTRPTAGLYATLQAYETDTGRTMAWTGTEWMATTLVSGKMWRTAGASAALTINTEYVVVMGGSRLTGGFTYDQTVQAGAGGLVLPLDGYYSFIVYAYLTNSASGLIGNWLTRVRASVANSNFVTGPIGNKPSAATDGLFAWPTMNYPLKGGDKISMSIYPYVGGLSYYGTNDAQGCVVEAIYRGPLGGAIPV